MHFCPVSQSCSRITESQVAGKYFDVLYHFCVRNSDASFWPERKDDVKMVQEGLISINVRRQKEEWEYFKSNFTDEDNGDTERYGEKEVHVYLIFVVNDLIFRFCFLPFRYAQ